MALYVKKWLLLNVFCLLAGTSAFSQDLSISPARPLTNENLPRFLKNLSEGKDLTMAFTLRNLENKSAIPRYFVLTRRGSSMGAYRISGRDWTPRALNLPGSSLEMVWKTMLQNNIMTIRDEKDIPNFCAEKYRVFNSYSYDFILISGAQVKTISFVEPEYYDEACYGMEERKQVINMADAIRLVLADVQPAD